MAAMMTMVLLKRANAKLDRDVIFVSEAGEEAATGPGIEYLVDEHLADIDAEICLAEGGGVRRHERQSATTRWCRPRRSSRAARAWSRKGPAGHGSRPMRTNAIVHLSRAVEKIAMWDPPMRFNDTTRYYFEKLATISTPEEAARYKGLFDAAESACHPRVSRRERSGRLLHAAHFDFAQYHSGRLPGQRDSVRGRRHAGHPRAARRKYARVSTR